MTADPESLATLHKRRAKREIELRFNSLVLQGLLRGQVESLESWMRREKNLQEDPLSISALGFRLLMKGKPLDELEALEDLIKDAGSLDVDRVRDIAPILKSVVSAIGAKIKEKDNPGEVRDLIRNLSEECEALLREFASGHKTFVCSDVHLGHADSERETFIDLVRISKNGDTLILLGDILDFWIDAGSDAHMHEIIVAEWKDLHNRLLRAKEEGVNVIYVPGNHDSFVFTLETEGHFDWSGTVLRHSTTLRGIKDAVSDYPLVSVADIVYPFLKLTYGTNELLLTHGHAHEWLWRLTDGSPELQDLEKHFLLTISSVFAHRYARQLRHVFNIEDTVLASVRRVQDVAIEITNQHLQAFKIAELRTLHGKTTFADELAKVFRDLCTDADNAQKLGHQRALNKLKQYREVSDLKEVRKAVQTLLNTSVNASNYRFEDSAGLVSLIPTPFSKLADFKDFACGHFHAPRDEPPNYDSGCFFDQTRSCLQVNEDGAIVRPTIE